MCVEPGDCARMPCGGRIVIIEHDQECRERLAGFVRGVGCCVATAPDGASGLAEVMDGVPPCLVLLDLDAPRLEGPGFLLYLRQHASCGGARIVAVSSAGGDPVALPEVEHHLTKPFSPDVLWPIVDRSCRAAIRIEADPPASYAESDL